MSWLAGLPIRLALMLAALAVVWLPELQWARWVPLQAGPADVAAHVAEPAADVLSDVAAIDLAELNDTPPMPPDVARRLEAGTMDWPGVWPRTPLRGYPGDYLGARSLYMASLAVENLALQGYARTGDPVYLRVALDRIVQMAAHEAGRRHDRTFLWNDHAVAARVSALVALWRHVREDAALRARHGEAIVSFVRRTGQLLADPAHFTVRTNHGVMQNLALLQLCAAFPRLPDAAAWRQLARQRLELQLGYYVSPEGMVLEHSAGYHVMGHRLIHEARALLRANGLPPLEKIERTLAAVERVTAAVVRPDGTLPMVGNSVSRAAGVPVPPHPRLDEATWLPVSGWAVWRSPLQGDAAASSHVMLAWSKFDGHGHKRADETSVHLWSRGTDWITPSGYWPYGAPLEAQAASWLSSNAVHAPGEEARSQRSVTLLATGADGERRYASVRRSKASGASYERQVVQLGIERLLVLDFIRGSPGGSETLWTAGVSVGLRAGATGSWFVSDPLASGHRLTLAVHSPVPGLELRLLRGSSQPFGGWVVVGGEPRPSDSVLVGHAGADAVIATLIDVSVAGGGTVRIEPGATPSRWSVALFRGDASERVELQGSRLVVSSPSGTSTLLLVPAPAAEIDLAQWRIREAYAEAVQAYPPWRDLWYYRERVTLGIVGLAVLLEAAHQGWSWRRSGRRKAKPITAAWPALSLHAAVWLTVAAYLHFIYFVAT